MATTKEPTMSPNERREAIEKLVELMRAPNMERWGEAVRAAAVLGIGLDWTRAELTFADGYTLTFCDEDSLRTHPAAVLLIEKADARALAPAAPVGLGDISAEQAYDLRSTGPEDGYEELQRERW